MRCGAPGSPERTCIGCRATAPKSMLVRLGVADGGAVETDGSSGRGAYVHRARGCVEAAMRPALLARALRKGLSADEVGRLRERVEGELESV
jgi:predicted RNA-binding protein YlxR (DUF448 family)